MTATKRYYSQFHKRSKLGNRWSVCNQGHKHQSIKESRRCNELSLLKRAREISNLEQQPKFIIQERFTYNGEKIRAITYSPDFMYTECGQVIVEDVKGHRTQAYLIKKKMFLKYLVDNNLPYNFIET